VEPAPTANDAEATIAKICALFEALSVTSPATSALAPTNSATVLDWT